MRILHIISSADPRGGGPIEGIQQRGLALLAMGHQPEVLTLDDPADAWVSAFPLPVHATGPAYGSYAWAPGLVPWLRKHARSYDAFVISGLWQYHGWAASRVLRSMGLPYHVFTHGMLDPWFRDSYRFKHFKKWIYWRLAEHQVLRHAKAALFTSQEEKLRAREPFKPYQVVEEVVDYGTNPPPANGAELRQAFRDAHPQLAGKRLVLFLGRIHVKKGCDLLVQAFAQVASQHAQLHLVMAGPGGDDIKCDLEQLAVRLGVQQRTTWLGMLRDTAKWQALYGCDVFVLPSHQENFGIAVAEALGCGLPVLLSDKVNTWREVVADGAGLVAPDTLQGTVHNLQRWLALNPAALAAMGQQARSTFTARYTAQAAAQSLLKVLKEPRGPSGHSERGRMNILHVVSSVDPRTGGVAESIRSRGVKLLEMGHVVEVLSLDLPGSAFVSDYPLPLHALGPGFTAWQYSRKLVPWIRDNARRFDAVVVDGIWQYHGLATRRALKGTGVPYFVFPHGMLDPWFKRTYPLKHLKKCLVWPWADYRVLRDAKGVLFTCQEERDLAARSFQLYNVRPQVVAFGASNPPSDGETLREEFLLAYPNFRGKPLLLYLGRVHPKKGCDILIEAYAGMASSLKEVQLLIAGPGDGKTLAALKEQVHNSAAAGRIHWLGMLEGRLKWGALFASDGFVLPSHQENFGIAVVEALSCGVPVIISNKVNIWREVEAGSAGFIDNDDVAGTTRSIGRWYAAVRDRRDVLMGAARQTYRKNFAIDAMAAGLLGALKG